MMRLRERELTAAHLVRRVEKIGRLGSRPEAFSDEKIPFRASVQSMSGELRRDERGMKSGERLRIIAPQDLGAKTGDGVWIGDDFYIVHAVHRWTAHIELECGARA